MISWYLENSGSKILAQHFVKIVITFILLRRSNMKKLKKIYLFLLFIIFSTACSNETSDDILMLGTFNIEWLGDGKNDYIDRKDSDYKNIANVIKDTDADILVLQEIENQAAIDRVLEYLPNHDAYISDNGASQNLGVVYRKSVNISNLKLYYPLKVDEKKTRPALIFECKTGDFQAKIMVVHFKSTSRYDSTTQLKELSYELRRKQSAKAAYWADSIRNTSGGNVIIAGDFNDNPKRSTTTLKNLIDLDGYYFLTSDLKSDKNSFWDGHRS
ncbi:MAG: hypothetical protein B7C24_15635 [Bacteroidetes bacterium 4572_77]|nr:MAG: hypothetical protein B7C24_15635 [Bacteroidetes bacterium 4572_77]